jgi:hypothetical protein
VGAGETCLFACLPTAAFDIKTVEAYTANPLWGDLGPKEDGAGLGLAVYYVSRKGLLISVVIQSHLGKAQTSLNK